MEKVQIEAEFKADAATKAAQAYYQNFTTAKGVLTAVNAAHKAYENTLAGQAKKLADLKKVLDHTEIGTKKYLDLQKEIAKLEKNSKPAEGMKQMGAVMTGVMQGVGQGIFSTLTGAFGRAQGAILANIPAIGQAFDMAGQIVSNNLFRPLAQELYPIIIKIFQWISENRIVFVKLGTVIVSAFRMVWTVVSSVFNLFKAGFKAIADQIGAGQLTIKKFMDFMNFLMLKISLVFIFLEEALKPVMEAIGTAIGIVLNQFKEMFNFIVDFIKEPMDALDKFDALTAGLAAGGIAILAGALYSVLVPAVTAATSSVAAFTVALLANPMTWIVVGVVALVTAIVALYKNWDKITAFFKSTMAGIKKGIYDNLVNPFINLKDTIFKLADQAVEKAKKAFEDLGNNIRKIFDTNYIGKMIDKMKAGLQGLGKSIKDSLAGTFDSLLNFDFSQIGTAIKRAFTGAFDDIKNTDIGKVFTKLAEKIQGKAAGGRITKGQPYVVGEKGQELIVPDSNGFVMNNSDLSSLTKPTPILGKSNTASQGNYTDSRSFKIEINGGNIEQIKNEVIKIIQDSKPNYRDAFLSTQRKFA